jgi:hypothetical protein
VGHGEVKFTWYVDLQLANCTSSIWQVSMEHLA